MTDLLSEHDRIELLARAQDAWDRAAAKYNESGFRMAWKNLRRLPFVGSVAHSHRGRRQGLLTGTRLLIMGSRVRVPPRSP